MVSWPGGQATTWAGVDPLTEWVSGINLNNAGFAIVGRFAATWLCAITSWKGAGVEQ